MAVDGTTKKVETDGGSQEGRRKEKRKKKHLEKDQELTANKKVDSTPVDEPKVPSTEKKEKKRKRDGGEDVAHTEAGPRPRKKSKNVINTELGKPPEELSPQDEKVNSKKKEKRQKSAFATAQQPQSGETMEKPRKKKRKNKTSFPDPEGDDDTGLSDQARKALGYAFSQFHDPTQWKFNKARQNWLVRNFWSTNSIPEKYEDLVIQYLSAVQGNTRENLIKACRAAMDDTDTPSKEAQTPNGQGNVGGALIEIPSPLTSEHGRKRIRAQSLLQTLVTGTDS
ncbi:hypothetical protein P691DRAFT_661563 [Macrolepiota fuliginosa MF-IS2]|uniref:WKF domain-containing protein n=1 Tax=Macrolepiota fuliginosa MF-IS2 TaxID=1400762 RepID=A0A9P6C598_9AGAR|nr:hypothetical protein P691DRAFT_661563 [Macrolepiota fuliginosa MF-IS2]